MTKAMLARLADAEATGAWASDASVDGVVLLRWGLGWVQRYVRCG